ncbi:MAG: hypothetical protein JWN24_4133 [Phycisphaerales bacterium]|nr:hypothetical protein [Phycisphaerales bacterium]
MQPIAKEVEFLSQVAPVVRAVATRLHMEAANRFPITDLLDRIDHVDSKARALLGMYLSTYRHWYALENDAKKVGEHRFLDTANDERLVKYGAAKDLAQQELASYAATLG